MPLVTVNDEPVRVEGTLNEIFTRLDRGEIDVKQAYDDVQEYDRRHRSFLDRLLAVLAG